VLDAVRRDLDHRARAAGRLTAALAGPRATAAVLAALPLVGLLLGQAVGAAPWRVLTGSVAGQVLLVLGSGLACIGVIWSARLVGKVALS
jgi:tight adherence protein B